MSNVLYCIEEYRFQRNLGILIEEIRLYGDVLPIEYNREKVPLYNLGDIDEQAV